MPEETVWPLDEHTVGKHLVLKAYLDAWFPILSARSDRLLFIDGFAGPGEYKGGEEGSPLIAIRSVREHKAAEKIKEVVCFFVEEDEKRCQHLDGLITRLKSEGKVPSKCTTCVAHSRFDEHTAELLDYIEGKDARLVPTFVMVDPFGVSDTPMSVIERLLKHEQMELYVSVMYEFLNRFKDTREFEPNLDRLFGTADWKRALAIEDATQRKEFLYELYEAQLRKAGAKYVVKFELYSGQRLKYAIFFATKHPLGADKMKQAIWKIAPTGDFAFRGGRGCGQLALELDSVDFTPLATALQKFFNDRNDWVSVESVEEFVVAETDYTSSHYKKQLKKLESEGHIEVDPGTRKMKGTYPAGTKLRAVKK